MELLNTTKQERKDTLNDLEKTIKDLKKEISQRKDEISEMTDENIAKITRRKNVRRTIARIKLGGNVLMILGALLALSCLYLFSVHLLLGILVIAGGVALAVFGLIVRGKWKAHANELDSANSALSDYDVQVQTRKDEIREHEQTIEKCKEQIDEIKDFEKYEGYYCFEADCERGYLAVFTTGNEDTTAKEPRAPKKKARYNPDFLTNTQVFLNEVCCDEAKAKKFDRQKGAFNFLKIEDTDFCKFHMVANYLNGTEACDWISTPAKISKASPSQFIWNHISLYEGGCEVYSQDYDSLQSFMEAVGLTKEDIQDMLK